MAAKKRRSKGSGRVYKIGDSYYLQYTDNDGKRKNVTLKDSHGNNISTLREAEEAANQFILTLQQQKEIESREEYLTELKAVQKLKAKYTITLDNAFELALAKPHIREASENVIKVSRRYWADFVYYVKDNYKLKTLDEVERMHADAYIAYIRKNGRWHKTITFNQERCSNRKPFKDYQQGGNLSPTTLNRYQSVCKSVFTFLLPDLGCSSGENPFSHILPLKLDPVPRKNFTTEELDMIFKCPPPFLKNPFYVGRYTGMRLGDAATLKWEYIENLPDRNMENPPDFLGREISFIAKKTKHTKTEVFVPVLPELNPILQQQWTISRHSEYVFPELAELYIQNRRNKINNMIQNYLHSLGIVTQVQVEGRSQKQTIKGFHSFRHTFSYEAEQKGVPPSTIQRWLGHKRICQTQHYQNHANKQASLEGLKMMMKAPEPVPAGELSKYSIRKKKLLKLIQDSPESKLVILEKLIDNLPAILFDEKIIEPDVKQPITKSDSLLKIS